MGDSIFNIFGGLMGNTLGNSLGNSNLQGLSGMPQDPYMLQQQLQNSIPTHTLPQFFNYYEIGSDQWERREWDRRFAESMDWDCDTFYSKLRGLK